MRFETEPGQQAQFDWSPYTVEIGGELRRLVVYGMTLAYSRRKHYTTSFDERQPSIFEAIEEGLWHFGGSAEELLVDNPKAFVVDANPKHFRWNPQFLELCGHYRIRPHACRPAWPRTKEPGVHWKSFSTKPPSACGVSRSKGLGSESASKVSF